jgi:FkbM family methyltransferase
MSFENLFIESAFAGRLKETPISFFDVGARGGFDPDLLPVAFGVDATGFEPNSLEFERLQGNQCGPWKTKTFLPHAIGEANAVRTLHIPADPQGASLLAPIDNLPERFSKNQFFRIIDTEQVETVTLDHVLEKYAMPLPEYLKIDIEGLELAVLKSSPKCVTGLLAIKIEIAFAELRSSQPLAWEIEAFMQDNGFMLMDFTGPSHWRNHGHVIAPHMSDEVIPFSRGQLIHGDYLFFRNPTKFRFSQDQKFKMGNIAMSTGFFDFAEEMFSSEDVLKLNDFTDKSAMNKALARCSRQYGRKVARQAFLQHLRLLGPYIRRFNNLVLS